MKTTAAILALGLFAWTREAGAETRRTARCEGGSYAYLLEAPPGNQPKPAILLLHGAGGNGGSVLGPWRDFGLANGIVLIAPNLPRDAAFEPKAPAVFRCVVEDARAAVRLDPKRIYVFGHSMGGYLAYDAAMFESEYFAAAAVHAAGIAPDYDGILAHAIRKIPIAIWIGDADALVPLASVRRTRDLLLDAGFPVVFSELKGHGHDYEGLAPRIHREVWSFFEAHRLP